MLLNCDGTRLDIWIYVVSMLRVEEFGSHMGHGTEYIRRGPCVGIMEGEDLVGYMIHVAGYTSLMVLMETSLL